MYNWWVIWQLSNMRHKELIKEAEIRRLAWESKKNSKRKSNGLCILLNSFGKMLVAWGSLLQKRYGTAVNGKLNSQYCGK